MPTMEVFADMCGYMKLAVSAVVGLALCWVAFEVYVFVAGSLGPVNQATASVIVQLIVFHDILRQGCLVSTICLTGNAIGEMNVRLAKKSYRLTFSLETAINVIIMLILSVFRRQIALFYAPNDEDLYELLTTMLPIAGLIMLAFLGTMLGVVFALHLQAEAAIIILATQWIITLPVALYVAYNTSYGIKGLFLAQAIGLTLQIICWLILIETADWDDIATKARERMIKENTLNEYQSLPQDDEQIAET